LRPFFSFYGGKWRSAPKYPPPVYDIIVEPFAGSAGYSVRYPDRNVILVERDPEIAETWRYLIKVSSEEILALPDLELEQTVDDLNIHPEARTLIGWWLNKGASRPSRRPSSNMKMSVMGKRQGDPPSGWWGSVIRERIASQVGRIRHWTLIEGDYRCLQEMEATWFIDPPYVKAGKYYKYGPKTLNYTELGAWCRSRTGQVMVCENVGATWLPFRPWLNTKANESRSGGKVSREALWMSVRDLA